MFTGADNGEADHAIQEQIPINKHNGFAVIDPGSTLGTGSYAVSVDSGTLDASDTLTVGAANDEVLFNGGVQSLSGSTNIGIDSVPESNGNEQYRYTTIWADASGEIQKTQGTAVEVADIETQNNLTRFERFKGTIPFPSTYPSVVIAVVVVSSNDTSVTTDNLRDYRIPADETVNDLDSQSHTTETQTVNTSLTDPQSNTISDFVGDGLTTASNVLQANLSNGLEFSSGAIQTALGNGLNFSGGDIQANLGDGLDFASGAIQANLGDGLDFASGAIQILDSIWDGNNIVADVDNQSVVTENLTLTEEMTETVTFGSNETRARPIGSGYNGDNLVATATPANDPGNRHIYSVDGIRRDSDGTFYAVVTETEGAGGGDCKITAWTINTP
jgi:hypothetical protein